MKTRIKEVRKSKGLTQKELGKLLGVSASAVSQFESDNANIKTDTLSKIAEALDCHVMPLLIDKKERVMIDIETAKGYMRDLEADAHWLTEYAQNKKDCQKLIYITVTMNRARYLIGELIGEHERTQRGTDCPWK